MITRLDRRAKERRNIDIDMIRRDFLSAQSKHISKGKRHDRPVMSGVSHFSLASGRCICTPTREQQMLAGPNGRKKSRHGSRYRGTSNYLVSIAETESRVRRQKLNKALRVCRIDGRKQSAPPKRIGQGLSITATNYRGLIILDHGFRIRASRVRSTSQDNSHASCSHPA